MNSAASHSKTELASGLLVLSAALCAFLVAGCGKADSGTQAPTNSTPESSTAADAGAKVGANPKILKFKVTLEVGSKGDRLRIHNLNGIGLTGLEVVLNDRYKSRKDFMSPISPEHPFPDYLETQFQGRQPGMMDVPLEVFEDDQRRSFGHKNFIGIKKVSIVTPEGSWSGPLSQ